ncbi:hypothetical protein BT96DRAFT_836477, partial [Gymnopus androsaceus JB14]
MDIDGDIDTGERSRQLLLKTANKLIAKRELSSQQVATSLIGEPSYYTNRAFPRFYWSDLPAQKQVSPDEDDSLIFLSNSKSIDAEKNRHSSPSNTLFNDFFFRPLELLEWCAWDIMRKYAKDKLPRSPTQIKTYLRFQPAHPQYSTHCLKEITDSEKARIPVLVGYSIPRNDKEDQEIKYAVAMLALFKPWSNNKLSPLKPEGQTWVSAFKTWDSSTSARAHQKTMRNMQLQYESKDAKVDYSA